MIYGSTIRVSLSGSIWRAMRVSILLDLMGHSVRSNRTCTRVQEVRATGSWMQWVTCCCAVVSVIHQLLMQLDKLTIIGFSMLLRGSGHGYVEIRR